MDILLHREGVVDVLGQLGCFCLLVGFVNVILLFRDFEELNFQHRSELFLVLDLFIDFSLLPIELVDVLRITELCQAPVQPLVLPQHAH